MSKRNPVKKFQHHKNPDQEFAFDFSDFIDPPAGEEMMAGMMSSLIQASLQQTQAAVELTKLALAKNPSLTLTDADVFATFKEASQVIQDTSPLKTLWEKFSLDNE